MLFLTRIVVVFGISSTLIFSEHVLAAGKDFTLSGQCSAALRLKPMSESVVPTGAHTNDQSPTEVPVRNRTETVPKWLRPILWNIAMAGIGLGTGFLGINHFRSYMNTHAQIRRSQDNLVNDIAALRSQILNINEAELRKKITELENQLKSIDEKHRKQNAVLISIQSEISNYKSKLEKNKIDQKNTVEQTSKLQTEVKILETKIQDNEKELQRLAEKREELHVEIIKIKKITVTEQSKELKKE